MLAIFQKLRTLQGLSIHANSGTYNKPCSAAPCYMFTGLLDTNFKEEELRGFDDIQQ